MKTTFTFVVGIALGISLGKYFGENRSATLPSAENVAVKTTEKQIIRRDQVTLQKEELEHVVRAIGLLKDQEPSLDYTRYVADSGAIAFDCPTSEGCNLEVPARLAVKGREIQVTMKEVVTTTSSVTARKSTGSIYARLGLQSGDRIVSINGEALNDPSDAMARLSDFSNRFSDLKTGSSGFRVGTF